MNHFFPKIRFLKILMTGKTALFLLIIFNLVVYSQSTDEPFDFPVKPGTPEWAKFQTHDKMLQACQIPFDLLKMMSSDALAKTCLDYPLFVDMLAYSSFNEGIEQIIKQFNGLRELLGRKDAGKSLLDLYSENILSKQDKMVKESYFEMILSRDYVLNNLTKEEKKRLMKASLSKYKEKRMNPVVYGAASLTSSGLVIGKLMRENKSALSAEVTTFLSKGNIVELELLDQIYDIASKTYSR